MTPDREKAWVRYQQQLMKHTVALVVFEPTSQLSSFYQGSGVLVKLGNRFLIATCSHNFAHVNGKQFRVLAIRKSLKPFYESDAYKNSDVRYRQLPGGSRYAPSAHDLAFIEVEPDEFLEAGHEFYDAEVIPEMQRGTWVAACGNPAAMNDSKTHFKTRCVTLSGTVTTDPEYSLSGELIQNDLIRANLETTQYLVDGEVTDHPDSVGGVSGGGVWYQHPNGSPILMGLLLGEDSTNFFFVNINCWLKWAGGLLDL